MMGRLTKLGALGLSIVAGCGTTDTQLDEDAAPFVQMGGETYRVLDLGLDSETYRELAGPFGSVGNVSDLGPSTSGHREVRIRIDAHGPASIYEFLLASWNSPPVPGASLHHTSFGVLLGGSTQAVGLLVPAVQKFGGVSIEEDGSLVIEIAGDGTIDSVAGGTPQATAGGVNVAAGDVNGYMSGEQAGQLVIAPAVALPHFAGSEDGMTSSAIRFARPTGVWPTWFDFEKPVAVAVDIREPGGVVLHRFRMEQALPQPDDGLDITLKPARAAYIKIDGIKGESMDEAQEAALVTTSYASFSNRTYLAARSQLESFAAIDSGGGTPTYDDLVAYWTTERASTITALHDVVAHAAELEGLLCQAAVPMTATLATELAKLPLSVEAATALASVHEATRALPAPVAGAYAGGPLAISSLAGAAKPVPADVAPACRALGELAPFADALIASGAVDGKAGYLNQAVNSGPSPRALDRDVVAWIELVDAIVAGSVIDSNAARTAARAKADILIEALNAHAQAASSRHDLAHLLVGG